MQIFISRGGHLVAFLQNNPSPTSASVAALTHDKFVLGITKYICSRLQQTGHATATHIFFCISQQEACLAGCCCGAEPVLYDVRSTGLYRMSGQVLGAAYASPHQ